MVSYGRVVAAFIRGDTGFHVLVGDADDLARDVLFRESGQDRASSFSVEEVFFAEDDSSVQFSATTFSGMAALT
ncbi:hypothetical protein [Ferrovibrio sp.]|uniref:hypothetical protein n=1 Tax=Ferrovibrio sp. TaxID=1917215 RepID=UPI0025B8C8DE|nr:hypothetical protein [Ferrovibrio sp.]